MTDHPFNTTSIGFIGAGNMAEAIVKGLLDTATTTPERIIASDPSPERRAALTAQYGIRTVAANAEVVAGADVIVLAVKPQVTASVLAGIAPLADERKLVISIVAGWTLAALRGSLPGPSRIVRTMPNTPVFVREGMVAIAIGDAARPEDYDTTEALFRPVARTVRVPEGYINAVIGVSGSGPAYAFLMIEALADGGVKMGLPRKEAQILAAQTLLGAARMVLETGRHPGELKDMVCSPGGTTIAAVHALEKGGLRAVLMDAVEAATRRGEELGKPGA